MTIQQKLLTNVCITSMLFLLSIGLISWGAYRYDFLQKGVQGVDHEAHHWLLLDFQVSQYLKLGMERVLENQPLDKRALDASTDEIIHTFILLEKTAHDLEKHLASSDLARNERAVFAARDQFGHIHEELEKTISLLNQGLAREASLKLRKSIVQAHLDRAFVEMIGSALKSEEAEETRIEAAFSALKSKLVLLFTVLAAVALASGVFLMSHVNRSVQGSIQIAQRELLRGADSISSGNFDTSIQLHSKDELSVVAAAFNKMAKDLKSASELIHQQQAQLVSHSKMSALGEMAGGIAHEINTPLATIAIRAEQLKELAESREADWNFIIESTDAIHRTSSRIARIIQGLRSFARDGRSDPFVRCSVRAIVEETLDFCKEKFSHHGIALESVLPKGDLLIECRPSQISQVILNLAHNAHDAVTKLPEKWVRIEVIERKEDIEISVTDSGLGIAEDVRDKIMQPFFTTKEVGKGTGLGLSISQGIVKSHHGGLSVDPASKNTRFVVHLPKAQPDLNERKTAA